MVGAPAVVGTRGRVAVRKGEDGNLILEEASGTERDVRGGGGECSILAEFGIAIGGVVD